MLADEQTSYYAKNVNQLTTIDRLIDFWPELAQQLVNMENWGEASGSSNLADRLVQEQKAYKTP